MMERGRSGAGATRADQRDGRRVGTPRRRLPLVHEHALGSSATTVAPPSAAASIVSGPIVGTSKRKSCSPPTAFTIAAPRPLSAVPRRMAAVVPSIASTALTAPRRTTTVCPTLRSAPRARPRAHGGRPPTPPPSARVRPAPSRRAGRAQERPLVEQLDAHRAEVASSTALMLPSSRPPRARHRAVRVVHRLRAQEIPIQNLRRRAPRSRSRTAERR